MYHHLYWTVAGLLFAGLGFAWLRDHWARIETRNFADYLLAFCYLALIALVWLLAIREAQFAPHRITSTLNGHVLSSFMATNNEFIWFTVRPVWTTNGVEYRSFAVTNKYWHVWSIFRP